MKRNGNRVLLLAGLFLLTFIVWTILLQQVDVQTVGQNGTEIGFATWNRWFHELTGVHMVLYHITDWLGLIPVFVCILFCCVGLVQLVQRKSLFKVDYDILLLGGYYVMVILCYLMFEMIPINYRPVLIDGRLEVSYPSSTTLLVLCVMPTLAEQGKRRMKSVTGKQCICCFVTCFSVFMVLGRLVSGVHWLTDIVGAMLLGGGLFCLYQAMIMLLGKEEKRELGGSDHGIS
ncbi:MAG: phosphatase PAP2 family protein [Lachnospiraceae bacterium]|nr:phosphatase PAP2 family protein [Lachnospiraceae bacterium]